jgi:hypothetical protein
VVVTATEQASTVTTESGSLAKWASWLAALVGLWVLVSPFVLSGSIGSGTAMWSNVAAGIVISALAGFGAYSFRTAAEVAANTPGEWSGWIAALAGIWIVVSPFVLSGLIATGTVMWGNVVAGVVALILAGYTGYTLHSGG